MTLLEIDTTLYNRSAERVEGCVHGGCMGQWSWKEDIIFPLSTVSYLLQAVTMTPSRAKPSCNNSITRKVLQSCNLQVILARTMTFP